MNYCPYCGKQIEESFKHCPFCGAELNIAETTDEVVPDSEEEEIKEGNLIYILTNDDSPIIMAPKPIPIQKDILCAIEDICQGITPKPSGDLIIDGIIRALPGLLATFTETVYDLDYDEYDVKTECRNEIFNSVLNEMQNDKQKYPCIDAGKKRLKKANLTQTNFASLYCLKNNSYYGNKIPTKDIQAGQQIDVNFVMFMKYVRAIAIREACKSIEQIDLKLKAACYWYTYFSKTFGIKRYEAEYEGNNFSTKTVVKSTGEPITFCMERNDALHEISRQVFESALRGKKDNNTYEINENEADQLITYAWNNISVFATEKLEDTAPKQ